MKAAIYNGKEDVVVVDLESPICGDNDIIIKNIYSSICGTDVAVFNHGPATGHKVTVGGEFGHETISEVAAVGKNVRDIKVGQRVYPYPILAKGDKSRAGTLGGFSEYILVPNAELNKQVYAVSDKISSKVGCLIEPFTIGNRAARRAAPKQGESAIVFGAGTIGIAVSIALQQFGCGKIMVTDISDFRLEKVKGLGFEVCNSAKENLKEKSNAGVWNCAQPVWADCRCGHLRRCGRGPFHSRALSGNRQNRKPYSCSSGAGRQTSCRHTLNDLFAAGSDWQRRIYAGGCPECHVNDGKRKI